MQTKQAKSFLLWLVILATTISLCGFSNTGQHTPHANESAPAAASCMLGSCETLTSKNFSIPDAVSGFSSLLSPALLLFLFPFSYAGSPVQATFFKNHPPRKRNARRLHQLHAVFLI